MRLRGMRSRCEALLKDVDLPRPFERQEFCRRLSVRRGRRILLYGVDTTTLGLPSGCWYDLADADLVLYDAATTGYHQDGIVLHEVGHVMANHYADGALSEDVAAFLMPEIGRLQARRLAARHDYGRREEQEAEFFARFVLERVSRDEPGKPVGTDSEQYAVLRRLDDTFGY